MKLVFDKGDVVKFNKKGMEHFSSLKTDLAEITYELLKGGATVVKYVSGDRFYTETGVWFYAIDFDLVTEENDVKFDLHKEKWIIRTPTPEICEAVQLWLFEQNVCWFGNEKKVLFTETEALGSGHSRSGFLAYTPVEWWKDNGHKEVKLNFKTIVDSVIYPEPAVIETESQKQMKVLEEQIQKLIEQKDLLKETISKEGS